MYHFKTLPKSFQQIVLNVFRTISTGEIVFICQHMLEYMSAIDTTQPQTACPPEQWGLVMSRFILRQLSLEGVLHAYTNGSLSDYR